MGAPRRRHDDAAKDRDGRSQCRAEQRARVPVLYLQADGQFQQPASPAEVLGQQCEPFQRVPLQEEARDGDETPQVKRTRDIFGLVIYIFLDRIFTVLVKSHQSEKILVWFGLVWFDLTVMPASDIPVGQICHSSDVNA